jgi:hypothetical protein
MHFSAGSVPDQNQKPKIFSVTLNNLFRPNIHMCFALDLVSKKELFHFLYLVHQVRHITFTKQCPEAGSSIKTNAFPSLKNEI